VTNAPPATLVAAAPPNPTLSKPDPHIKTRPRRPFPDSAFRTLNTSKAAAATDVRPEFKINLLAKKWREERNFWIAAMGFTLWWWVVRCR
jgi:hypothetical protein